MSNRLFLILTTIIAFGLLDITFKLSSSKIVAYVLIPSLFVTVVLLSLPFALREKGPKPITKRSIFGYPLITGVCFSIGATAYNLTMERVPLSILSPAAASYVIIPIVLSIIFLRERPTRLQSLGIPSVIGGVIVLSNPSIGVPSGTSLDLISYLLMITCILFGGFMVYFSRMGVHIFGTCRFLTLSTFFALISSVLVLFSQSSVSLPTEHLIYVIVGGILIVTGRLTLFKAMKEIPMTILMPLGSLFPIIPMAFGIIFLGESLNLIQGIGAFFAIIGIMMLNR